MTEIENKILSLLELGYDIDKMLNELNIENEEYLADMIIALENKELIILDNKSWILTQKGKDILKEMKDLLKRIKIDYLHGNIDKDEFQKKRKELELLDKKIEDQKKIIEDQTKKDMKKDIYKEKKIICPKCEKENKIDSKFCNKCGEPLIKK